MWQVPDVSFQKGTDACWGALEALTLRSMYVESRLLLLGLYSLVKNICYLRELSAINYSEMSGMHQAWTGSYC